MRNDLVVEKMIQTIERIQRYSKGLTYDTFVDNGIRHLK
jgi:uncharacterized protein with HEPN domain